jgi:hypothetical protein
MQRCIHQGGPHVAKDRASSSVRHGSRPQHPFLSCAPREWPGLSSSTACLSDMTGPPASFSSFKRMWGSAAQVGVTYTFAPTWFFDINYTYAISGRYQTNYVSPFTSFTGGLTMSSPPISILGGVSRRRRSQFRSTRHFKYPSAKGSENPATQDVHSWGPTWDKNSLIHARYSPMILRWSFDKCQA